MMTCGRDAACEVWFKVACFAQRIMCGIESLPSDVQETMAATFLPRAHTEQHSRSRFIAATAANGNVRRDQFLAQGTLPS